MDGYTLSASSSGRARRKVWRCLDLFRLFGSGAILPIEAGGRLGHRRPVRDTARPRRRRSPVGIAASITTSFVVPGLARSLSVVPSGGGIRGSAKEWTCSIWTRSLWLGRLGPLSERMEARSAASPPTSSAPSPIKESLSRAGVEGRRGRRGGDGPDRPGGSRRLQRPALRARGGVFPRPPLR